MPDYSRFNQSRGALKRILGLPQPGEWCRSAAEGMRVAWTLRHLPPLLVSFLLGAAVMFGVFVVSTRRSPPTSKLKPSAAISGQVAKAGPTSLSQKIDRWLDARGHHLDAVMVQHRGTLVYSRVFNWFRADQPHELQSATKTISSILIGIALDDGLVKSLDQPVVELLPEYAVLLVGEKANVTVDHVLTMRTGLRWVDFGVGNSFERIEAAPDSVSFVLEEPLESKPGERFFYNTGSSHLLSAVVQRQTGMSAFEYAKRRLFEPLGITQVSWPSLADGRTQGGWGIYLSPEDMLKIGQMLSDGGMFGGRRIVSKSYVDEMFKRRVETHLAAGYGYQLWLPDDHGHKGLGAARGYGGQDIFVARDLDLVVIFTGSIGTPERNAQDIRLLLKDVVMPSID